MDKPEEILKQLNKQSAELQPNVLNLLEEIQQRFFTPEGELKAELTGQPNQNPATDSGNGLNDSGIPSGQPTTQATNTDGFWPDYDQPSGTPAPPVGGQPGTGGYQNPGSAPSQRPPIRQPNFLSTGSNDGNKRQSVAAGTAHQTAMANQELNEIFMAQGGLAEGNLAEVEIDRTYEDQVVQEEFQSTIPMARPVETEELEQENQSASTTAKNPNLANPHFINPPAQPQLQQEEQVEDEESIVFAQPETLERPLAVYHSAWLRGLAPDRQIGLITGEIMKKAPSVVSNTIQLVSTQDSSAPTHEVATRIAWELSIRQEGPVLLVDADFEKREISRQLDNVYLPGLAEALNQGLDWKPFIGSTGIEGLFWLPSGKADITHRKATSARWSVMSEQLKTEYRYVCIYSGHSNNIVAQTWGRHCDFTFLIASMQDELGERTKAAVDDLRRHDCRLAGLVTIK